MRAVELEFLLWSFRLLCRNCSLAEIAVRFRKEVLSDAFLFDEMEDSPVGIMISFDVFQDSDPDVRIDLRNLGAIV